MDKSKLIKAYHASNSEFDEFDINKIGSGNGGALFGEGFYFARYRSGAEPYGDIVKEYYLNLKNPFPYYTTDKNVVINLCKKSGLKYDENYLNSLEEYDFDDLDLLDNILDVALLEDNPYEVFTDMCKKAGYDSIDAGDEIVVFNPKSILNKNTVDKSIEEDLQSSTKSVENKFKKALSDYFQSGVINGLACSYIIFRDGTIIGAQTHRDMYDYLEECGIVPDDVVESGFQVEIFADFLGCIRCTNLRDENYIELPTERLTAAQYSVLERFLEHNLYTLLNPEIIVTQGTGNAMSFDYEYPYNPNYKHAKYIVKDLVKDGEEPVDYIINKIKRMYASGVLLENDSEEVELVPLVQNDNNIISENLPDIIEANGYLFSIHTDFLFYQGDEEIEIDEGIWFIIKPNDDGSIYLYEPDSVEKIKAIGSIHTNPITFYINPEDPEKVFDDLDMFVRFWRNYFGWGFEDYIAENNY